MCAPQPVWKAREKQFLCQLGFKHQLTFYLQDVYIAYKNLLFFFLLFLWRCGPTLAMASTFLRFLDHTQRRIRVSKTPLDEWSARCIDLYLTTHSTCTLMYVLCMRLTHQVLNIYVSVFLVVIFRLLMKILFIEVTIHNIRLLHPTPGTVKPFPCCANKLIVMYY